MEDNYKFFSHKDCEFFPCHDVDDNQDFNCLFCYCPLYTLGSECGGNFAYNKKGIKDCSKCSLPHRRGGYEYIISKFSQVSDLAKVR